MESPRPERPHDARGSGRVRPASVIAAATIAATVLVTGVSIAAADNPETPVLGGMAAKYVPADGHLEWSLDNLGVVRMSESARTIGYSNLLQLPLTAGATLFDTIGEEVRTAQLWRESVSVHSGAEPLQTTDLHRLSAEGLTLLASHGGPVGFAFSPGLLELPADVAPGVTWSSAGDALPNKLATYTSEFRADAPWDESLIAVSGIKAADLAACLQTDGTINFMNAEGQLVLEIVETDLWCEGRGRVAAVGTVNGDSIVQGAHEDPPTADDAGGIDVPLAWSDVSLWGPAETEIHYPDPYFGEQQLMVSLSNAPQRTASGLIVSADQNADDLVAVRLEGGVLQRAWFAHPGGEIISLTTAGNITIVTTSERQVIAYSDAGRRLWAMDTPELVFAPPTDAGDGSAIIVGLDGIVSNLDLRTGDLNWERKLAADVSLSAAVAGDSVVVVDRAGAVTAFDLGSGDTLWSARSGAVASAAISASGVVVLVGDDGFLRTYDAATGTPLWFLRYVGFLSASADLGDSLVLVTDESTLAIEPRTGFVRWTQPGAEDAVTDGVRVVLLGEDTARIVDATGFSEGEWSIPSLALAIYRYALPGADGFWVFRSNQPAIAVGQP